MSDRPAKPLSIAIDGPAAAGKSTTARAVARRLGLLYVDSGAMYRALALKLLRGGVDPGDATAVERVLSSTTIDLADREGETRVILDGEDVTEQLRDERVATLASTIAPLKPVRTHLVERQREIAADRGVVMEGRDIGTVVLPEAEVKIFLTALLDIRAQRRRHELEERGQAVPLADVRRSIAERDRRDVERTESPLRSAPEAVEVDTSRLTIAEQVERVLSEVRRQGGRGPDPGRPLVGPAGHEAPVAPAAPTGRLPRTEIEGFYRLIRTTARGLARCLFRLRVEGLNELPEAGGFILASNHASLIDPPLLGLCATRRLGYLAKEELFTIPGLKQLITALGAVPIHRRGLDRGALETAKSVLIRGSGLVLFPEGTRTQSGQLGPARPGVSMLAAEAGVPVVPAHIQGTWRIGRALLRRPTVVVRFGKPIPPPATGRGPVWRAELRDHAGGVLQAIARLGGVDAARPRLAAPRLEAPGSAR